MKLALLLAALAALAGRGAAGTPALRVTNHAVCRGFPLRAEFRGAELDTHVLLLPRAAAAAAAEASPEGAEQPFEARGEEAVAALPLAGRSAGVALFPTERLAPGARYAMALCHPAGTAGDREGQADAAAPGRDVRVGATRFVCAALVRLTAQRAGSPVCGAEHQASVFGVPVDEVFAEGLVATEAALVGGRFALEVNSHTRRAEEGAAWFNMSAPAGAGGLRFTFRVRSLRPRLDDAAGDDGEDPEGEEVGACTVHAHVRGGVSMAEVQVLREASSPTARVASEFNAGAAAGARPPLSVNVAACAAAGVPVTEAAASGVARGLLTQYFRSLGAFVARDPCFQRQFLSPVQASANDARFTLGVHYERDTARANLVFKSPVLADVLGREEGERLLANAVLHGSADGSDDLYAPEAELKLLASPSVVRRLAAALADPELGARVGRVWRRASALMTALAESARRPEFLAGALRRTPLNPSWEFAPREGAAGRGAAGAGVADDERPAAFSPRDSVDVELLPLQRARVLCFEEHRRIAARVIEPDDSYGSVSPLFAHAEVLAGEALAGTEADARARGRAAAGEVRAAERAARAEADREAEQGAPAGEAASRKHERLSAARGADARAAQAVQEAGQALAGAAASLLETAASSSSSSSEGGLELPVAGGAVRLSAAALHVRSRQVVRHGVAAVVVTVGTSGKGPGAVVTPAGGRAVRVPAGEPLLEVAVEQRDAALVVAAEPLPALAAACGHKLAARVAAAAGRLASFATGHPCVQETYPLGAHAAERGAALAAALPGPRVDASVSFGEGAPAVQASVRLAGFARSVFRRQVPHRARALGLRAVFKRAGTHAIGVSVSAADPRLAPRAWSHALVNLPEMLLGSLSSSGAAGLAGFAQAAAEAWTGHSREAVELWSGASRADGSRLDHSYSFARHACDLRRWVSHTRALEVEAAGAEREGMNAGAGAGRVAGERLRASRGRLEVELQRVRQMRRLEDLGRNGTAALPSRGEVLEAGIAAVKADVALESLDATHRNKEYLAGVMARHPRLRVNPFEVALAVRKAADTHELLPQQRDRFTQVAVSAGSVHVLKDVTLRELVLREHELRAKNGEAVDRASSRAAASAADGYTANSAAELGFLDRGGADAPTTKVAP